MLIQIMTETASAAQNSGITDILMYGTGGSVITMILQKVLEYFKPKSERQINKFDVVDRLEAVVKQLQDVACYREKCNKRQNGEELENEK